jgi:hypothetical protein
MAQMPKQESQSRPIDYETPTKLPYTQSDEPGCVAPLLVVLIPPVVWFLYKLQGLPYRPPVDMGYLFDDGIRRVIWAALWSCCAFWLCAVCMVLSWIKPSKR